MTAKLIFSNNQKLDIRVQYLNNKKPIAWIAQNYNISVTPIKKVLKELEVKIRSPRETSRKYFLNENYFNIINTYDKVYFLGLLMADGYNNEKRGTVTLILVKKDKQILKRFCDYIKTNKPIIDVKSTHERWSDTCRMEICSQNISKKLSRYGCGQAKTFKLKFPKFLKGDLVRHFIRGYFDGDGCISYCYARRNNFFNNSFLSIVSFTSTKSFCLYLQKYFKNNLKINSSITCRHPDKKNNIRTLRISGNKQVIKFMKWLYKDVDLYLERKYLKFVDIKNILKYRSKIVSKLRSDNGKNIIKEINKIV